MKGESVIEEEQKPEREEIYVCNREGPGNVLVCDLDR